MAKINVRARAVDLLGRQQVAGIPTALSELFKNAHDAYADRVEVDFYRGRQLLVLRDDGVGMSRQDFESRWLTIGTESKAAGSRISPPPVDPTKVLRPVMGEKGIGRLAIALIGSQVLILTRPKFGPSSNILTAAYINWRLFELPGIDLSDIEIPIIELPGGTLPSAVDVQGMVNQVRENVRNIVQDIDILAPIFRDLDSFTIDPNSISSRLPEGPDISVASGTQFWILPVNEILSDNIDGFQQRYKATPLQKVLLGFSNTMTPGHPTPPIETKFRDHLTDGTWEERIAESNFLTEQEFAEADHRIQGAFDDRGQFSGTVSVYGKTAVEYVVHWPGAAGKDTLCGPLHINFAYLQGAARDSRAPKEEHDRLTTKLNKIGGLYIYRDGIRVLPYGDADYDFLDIEGRRTRSASYYFFSYRRMFGVIDITRSENGNLVEKAGREGFQENRAFRQMREMLENFFVQLAADFFREEGAMADVWEVERTRIVKEKELLAKRSRQVASRRATFAKQLDTFFERVNSEEPETAALKIIEDLQRRLVTATALEMTTDQLLGAERDARAGVQALREEYTIRRPKAVGLTRDLSRSWARYEVEQPRLEAEHFGPANTMIDELTAATASRLQLSLTPRRRIAAMIEDLSARERKRARTVQVDVQRNLLELRERALEYARHGFLAVETTIRSTLVDLERASSEEMTESTANATRQRLETSIITVADEQVSLLEKLREQLKATATPEALDHDDIVQALESELEERRERDLESLQLAQMGAAVGIVHHEFAAVIRAVRQNIRQLQSWAAKNPKLDTVYRDIRDSYSHLDGYLSLFAPLNRRLARSRKNIGGLEIYNYLDQLFGTRLEQNGITLEATKEFLDSSIFEFVSNIYPAFVNLVDNSIFWMSRDGEAPLSSGRTNNNSRKRITLDYQHDCYVISDDGPGILTVDQDAVFESGFSRKPAGSGLGLYITRSLLERAGYTLTLDRTTYQSGATFRIAVPAAALGEALIVDGGATE